MTPEVFSGPDLAAVLAAVRRAHGEDAMIVRTRGPAETGYAYEVSVLPAGQVPRAPQRPAARADRPWCIALVGPAGSGKTTAAAKLALRLQRESRRVALLTLDDFKIGGIEQMQLIAELTGLPLDVLHVSTELPEVRARLAAYDTIVIDTPGRRSGTGDHAWAPLLAALAPDEVHLVLHAGMRETVARRALAAFSALTPTHLLLTHTDELTDERETQLLETLVRLPLHWLCDAPELQHALRRHEPHAPALNATPAEVVPAWAASIAALGLGVRA